MGVRLGWKQMILDDLDTLSANGRCDSAVMARVICTWIKFLDYLPVLTGRDCR